MKKLTQMLSFMFLLIILSGCVDIPFGDSKIKISTNGVEVVDKDETDNERDKDGTGGKTDAGEFNNVINETQANNEDEEALKDEHNFASMNENGNLEENNEGEQSTDKPTALTNEQNDNQNTDEEAACDFDHSMFRDKIEGYDYYILECAELYDLIERNRNVTGLFFIENEDWQEVNDIYEAELENENITRTNIELKD